MKKTKWKTYEEVAGYLLNQFKEHFDLERVEGKQKIKGKKSGADWEIDAKGIKASDNEMFVIIECRRHTSAKQKQEDLAAIAYRINDTGAVSGIIVSPLGLQKGAKKIAEAEKVVEVTLGPNSTRSDYIMGFLNQIMVGVSETIGFKESVRVVITDPD